MLKLCMDDYNNKMKTSNQLASFSRKEVQLQIQKCNIQLNATYSEIASLSLQNCFF